MTFGGEDLYTDVPAKAAALMHSLVMNHPFVDGNKRVGAHAAVLFLRANHFQPGFAPEELTEVTLGRGPWRGLGRGPRHLDPPAHARAQRLSDGLPGIHARFER